MYIITYIICCLAIMFVLCALPWYGVLTISGWYIFLAAPSSLFASFLCHCILLEVEEILEME